MRRRFRVGGGEAGGTLRLEVLVAAPGGPSAHKLLLGDKRAICQQWVGTTTAVALGTQEARLPP
jgi:hypothetical protein